MFLDENLIFVRVYASIISVLTSAEKETNFLLIREYKLLKKHKMFTFKKSSMSRVDILRILSNSA